MIFALALRVAVIAADSGYEPAHDAFDYDRHARAIAAGDGYPESGYVVDGGPSALRPPGYPYVLGGAYALSGDSVELGRLANAALGALAVLLLYLLANRIWGRRVGLIAGALAAVFPPLVLASRDLLSEPLFIAIELAAVLCAMRCRSTGGELRWAAAAGALCGLGALTRNPGIVLVVPIALGVWALRPAWSTRALAAPAMVVLCTTLVIAPWTLRNSAEFGRFVPVTSSIGFALAGTYNQASLADDLHPGAFRSPLVTSEYEPLFRTPGVDEGTLDATLRREALGFAWDHPGYVAEVTGHNLLRLFELSGGSVVGARTVEGRLTAAPGEVVSERGIGSATPPAERIALAIAAPLALLGAFALFRSRRRAGRDGSQPAPLPSGPWFLWLVPIVLIAAAAPVNGLPRYRVPSDPFLLLLAAIGLVWAWDRLKAARASRTRGFKASVAALGAIAVLSLGGCGGDDGGGPEVPPTSTSAAEASDPEPEKQRYIARADAVCRESFREARELGSRFSPTSTGDALSQLTEGFVAPGIPLLEEFARRLRELEPRPDDIFLEQYLGLFDPGIELLHQRLSAGRAGDINEARRLEILLVELGDEQREAGRRFGFEICNTDFLNVLISGTTE